MCRAVTCPRCGRPTWQGCGAHVEQVLGDVPPGRRCQCPSRPGPGSAGASCDAAFLSRRGSPERAGGGRMDGVRSHLPTRRRTDAGRRRSPASGRTAQCGQCPAAVVPVRRRCHRLVGAPRPRLGLHAGRPLGVQPERAARAAGPGRAEFRRALGDDPDDAQRGSRRALLEPGHPGHALDGNPYDPSYRYLLHEVAEECQHMAMFNSGSG